MGLSVCVLFLIIATIVIARIHQDDSFKVISRTNSKAACKKVKTYRLPRHVVPKNYKLQLRLDLVKKTFQGVVHITLDIRESTQNITLHANYLSIDGINLKTSDRKNISVTHSVSGDTREFLYVNFKRIPAQKNSILKIRFSGKFGENLFGIYESTPKEGRKIVATQFEPTHARQAFPCFDEPDFKATFDITLVKPSEYIALANMNEIKKVPFDEENKTDAVTFATSVPMSTYLVCFVICDFDYIENDINTQGVGKTFQLRAFAQKHQMHKINFAQSIAKRATEFYIAYYQVPFPLPKLDMIAIPDYQMGGMENWGLITYRENLFLLDEVSASVQNKIDVANVVVHELAHMWFGDLVTLKWWDDIWLNEGFATYMMTKALDAIEPTWSSLELFLPKTMHTALKADAEVSSRPIVNTVETPDQITAIFDPISYMKAASVLRMLEGFIGKENFRQAVSQYLSKYKFGNTVTQDLLSQMEPYFKKNNPDLNLTHIINTWTRQMGYPVLTVTISDDPQTYVIKQEGEHLLKINNDQVGYYRVNYPVYIWNQLVSQLKVKNKQITISDRAHLLEEVFSLALAERVPHELAMNLTTYLNTETDYVPWEVASSIYLILRDKLRNTDAISDLLKYFQELVTPLYHKFSWDETPERVIDRQLRANILSLATVSGLPHAVEKVRSLFLEWLNAYGTSNPVNIEPDLREIVYSNAMKQATLGEWDKLLEVYKKEEDPQQAARLMSALAASRDPDILKRYLQIAWDEKVIRGQDYFTVLTSMAESNSMLVWDEIRFRWPQFVERFSLDNLNIGYLIPAVAYYFQNDLRLKEMEAFFAKYPEAGAGAAGRLGALETVRHNIKWQKRHQPKVAAWLKYHFAKKLAKHRRIQGGGRVGRDF